MNRIIGAVTLAMIGVGCSEEGTVRGPTPDEVPSTVSVDGTVVTAGFADGRTRTQVRLSGFRVTTTPITVGQYKQCVSVGACTLPAAASPACTRPKPPIVSSPLAAATLPLADNDLPLTCATPVQANGYCHWQRGGLPTLDQWFLAARGPVPRRFAWGQFQPDCGHHPAALQPNVFPQALCGSTTDFEVGKHPLVVSPAGVQDVLLAQAELVQPSASASFAACSNGYCALRGVFPGGIDSIQALKPDGTDSPAAAFRCAFPEVSR